MSTIINKISNTFTSNRQTLRHISEDNWSKTTYAASATRVHKWLNWKELILPARTVSIYISDVTPATKQPLWCDSLGCQPAIISKANRRHVLPFKYLRHDFNVRSSRTFLKITALIITRNNPLTAPQHASRTSGMFQLPKTKLRIRN